MSPSDKRRERDRDRERAHAHPLRTTSNTARARNNSSSNSSSVIAPPPRVAINAGSSSSSPGAVAAEDAAQPHDTSKTPSSSAAKDGTATSSNAPTVASLTALLREKDDKIFELSKELTLMGDEFARELQKHSQNESETATFWQAKHSALNQQFLRTDTELRLLQNEVELRKAEREDLRGRIEALRREAAEREEDIQRLRGQVRGLKEFVSTSTRADGDARTSDEVFGEAMGRLGNGLQNWVIMNFRRARLGTVQAPPLFTRPLGIVSDGDADLEKASEEVLEEIGELVPMYLEIASTAKVHLLQSMVSKILVDMVFDAYFFGLSKEQIQKFTQAEELLKSYCKPTPTCPLPAVFPANKRQPTRPNRSTNGAPQRSPSCAGTPPGSSMPKPHRPRKRW
jgi:activating signal cointegrator complex subunit 1